MSEVVVQLEVDGVGGAEQLMTALDAFAKWCEEVAANDDEAHIPEFMMTTVHTGVMLKRRLIFQERAHAAQFLMFWRSECRRTADIPPAQSA